MITKQTKCEVCGRKYCKPLGEVTLIDPVTGAVTNFCASCRHFSQPRLCEYCISITGGSIAAHRFETRRDEEAQKYAQKFLCDSRNTEWTEARLFCEGRLVEKYTNPLHEIKA